MEIGRVVEAVARAPHSMSAICLRTGFASEGTPAKAAAQEVAISHGNALKREHSSAAAKVVMCSRLCRDPCTPLTTSAVQQLLGVSPAKPGHVCCAHADSQHQILRH